MCVYGLRVSNDVNVEVAMIPIKTCFVTGVFLKPVCLLALEEERSTRRSARQHRVLKAITGVGNLVTGGATQCVDDRWRGLCRNSTLSCLTTKARIDHQDKDGIFWPANDGDRP